MNFNNILKVMVYFVVIFYICYQIVISSDPTNYYSSSPFVTGNVPMVSTMSPLFSYSNCAIVFGVSVPFSTYERAIDSWTNANTTVRIDLNILTLIEFYFIFII